MQARRGRGKLGRGPGRVPVDALVVPTAASVTGGSLDGIFHGNLRTHSNERAQLSTVLHYTYPLSAYPDCNGYPLDIDI